LVSTRSFMLRAVLVVVVVAISIEAQGCLGQDQFAVVVLDWGGRWRRALGYLTARLHALGQLQAHTWGRQGMWGAIELIGGDACMLLCFCNRGFGKRQYWKRQKARAMSGMQTICSIPSTFFWTDKYFLNLVLNLPTFVSNRWTLVWIMLLFLTVWKY
jgi:hypothetical protein